MGWSDRLRRRLLGTKTRPEEFAASLAETIVQSANLLQHRLEEEGFAWTDSARAGTDECLLECTIFEWFLRDIAASGVPRSGTEAIRRAVAGRLLVDLLRSGLTVAGLDDFDRRHRERFREYEEGLGVSSSLQALGALAWRRISGKDQPSERMTMLLAIRATAELARYRGMR